jgi:hypothetical protein
MSAKHWSNSANRLSLLAYNKALPSTVMSCLVNLLLFDNDQWHVSVASYRFEPKGVRINVDFLPKIAGSQLTCQPGSDEDAYLIFGGKQIQASSTLCTNEYHGKTWTPPVGKVFQSYAYFKVLGPDYGRPVLLRWFVSGDSSEFTLTRD